MRDRVGGAGGVGRSRRWNGAIAEGSAARGDFFLSWPLINLARAGRRATRSKQQDSAPLGRARARFVPASRSQPTPPPSPPCAVRAPAVALRPHHLHPPYEATA